MVRCLLCVVCYALFLVCVCVRLFVCSLVVVCFFVFVACLMSLIGVVCGVLIVARCGFRLARSVLLVVVCVLRDGCCLLLDVCLSLCVVLVLFVVCCLLF